MNHNPLQFLIFHYLHLPVASIDLNTGQLLFPFVAFSIYKGSVFFFFLTRELTKASGFDVPTVMRLYFVPFNIIQYH